MKIPTLNKFLKLDEYDFYYTHLMVINSMMPVKLTNMEIRVLASFLMLLPTFKEDTFDVTARRKVRERLNISYSGLSNYLNKLEKKGYIYKENGIYKIVNFIIPNPVVQGYNFVLVNSKYAKK